MVNLFRKFIKSRGKLKLEKLVLNFGCIKGIGGVKGLFFVFCNLVLTKLQDTFYRLLNF